MLWVLVVVVVMAGALMRASPSGRVPAVDGVEGFRRHMDALSSRRGVT
ncbi:MAG: hypothetical protein R2705_10285 [Ilumatobacteraceae bacterium]